MILHLQDTQALPIHGNSFENCMKGLDYNSSLKNTSRDAHNAKSQK
jgi:hypothetical protein